MAHERRGRPTQIAFQILLALVPGEKHGYAIMREVEAETGGALRLGPGTLYRTIKELLDVGWIAESATRPAPEQDDQRRRYYRLTGPGRQVAEAELARLEAVVRRARTRLQPAEAPRP